MSPAALGLVVVGVCSAGMFRSAIATDKSSLTEMNGRDCRSPRIKKGGKKWTCFLFYGQARRGLQIQKQ